MDCTLIFIDCSPSEPVEDTPELCQVMEIAEFHCSTGHFTPIHKRSISNTRTLTILNHHPFHQSIHQSIHHTQPAIMNPPWTPYESHQKLITFAPGAAPPAAMASRGQGCRGADAPGHSAWQPSWWPGWPWRWGISWGYAEIVELIWFSAMTLWFSIFSIFWNDWLKYNHIGFWYNLEWSI